MTSGRLSRYLNLRVAALLLPLALAAPGGGLATTLQRFDLAQLTANATQIFVGGASRRKQRSNPNRCTLTTSFL